MTEVHPSAVVDPRAELADDVAIGPYCVVGPGVRLDRGVRLESHVVVTGRNARPEVIEAADLVTEMTLVKHPFRAGVKAQQGIEY